MKKTTVALALAHVIVGAAWLHTCASPRKVSPVTPAADAVFTSTRQITSIAASDGEVWVGTLGGVLGRSKTGQWRKFTRLDGLPSQEARLVTVSASGVPTVTLPTSNVSLQAGEWKKTGAAPPVANAFVPVSVIWDGLQVEAGWNGMRIKRDGKWQSIPLPPSKGTHISALLPRREVLRAAMFGDGLWEYAGGKWKALDIGLPPVAREITAMAQDSKTGSLWIGTRRDGVWEYTAKTWTQQLQPDEPYDHNGQAMLAFKGDLFLSTLEDGLSVRTEYGWQLLGDATISSNAPRQMVEFGGALYLRHGGGKVDRFDGTTWKRDVFPWLPRKKAMALASDGKRLFIAQWGGWSEWDGTTWSHFLRLPELQGLPLMSLQPDGDTLWIGTQSRGILEATKTYEAVATPPAAGNTMEKSPRELAPVLPVATYQLKWHDERHALQDDWITCMATIDGTVYAGTFVGGLAYRSGEKWQHFKELEGQNVTALEPDGTGGLFIATREGVWQKSSAEELRRLNDRVKYLDTEAQALCKVPQGLWVATRTGLYFVTNASIEALRDVVAKGSGE